MDEENTDLESHFCVDLQLVWQTFILGVHQHMVSVGSIASTIRDTYIVITSYAPLKHFLIPLPSVPGTPLGKSEL